MINSNNLGTRFVLFFFLLMLVLPASFQAIRGILLMLIFVFSLRPGLIKKLNYDKTVIYLGIINVLASLFFILNGLAFLAPGAISVSTVYFIWPLLYLYFIGYNSGIKDIRPTMKVVLYGGIISALLIVIFIINSLITLPAVSHIADAQDFSIGVYDGFIELNSMNLATVLYTFAFSLTILLMPKTIKSIALSNEKRLTIICFIFSLILIIISARRAFWVICLLAPFIIVAIFKLSKTRIRLTKYIFPLFAIFIVISVTFVTLSLDLGVITKQFDTIFEFDNPEDNSNYLRKEQYEALISGWKERPVIGNGLGAAAAGSVRDDEAPWAYELSYFALLFQTGLVGIIVYGSSITWIFYRGIKLMRTNNLAKFLLAPQLVGLSCFLIVNGSNPYLAKFDYLWTIFLPVCTINALLIDKKNLKIENTIPAKIS